MTASDETEPSGRSSRVAALDPTAVMVAHAHHDPGCDGRLYQMTIDHCEPYRLAEGLAAERDRCEKALARTQHIESAASRADAWDEGVATALDHAIRNDDGVTLRLEHLDGRPWSNPYRTAVADQPEQVQS